MKSNSLQKARQAQVARIRKQVTEEFQRWVQHFGSDTAKGRIPLQAVTTDAALRDLKLCAIRVHVPEPELVAVISLQINSLTSFINYKNNLSDEQKVDTAEFILASHDDLSFTGIQHCFNLIKQALPPFNKQLYESLDGRKILELILIYKDYLAQYREDKLKEEKYRKQSELGETLKACSHPEFVKGMKALTDSLEEKKRKAQQEGYEKWKKAQDDHKKWLIHMEEQDKLVKLWTQEYVNLPEPKPKLDEYLKQRFLNAKKEPGDHQEA